MNSTFLVARYKDCIPSSNWAFLEYQHCLAQFVDLVLAVLWSLSSFVSVNAREALSQASTQMDHFIAINATCKTFWSQEMTNRAAFVLLAIILSHPLNNVTDALMTAWPAMVTFA